MPTSLRFRLAQYGAARLPAWMRTFLASCPAQASPSYPVWHTISLQGLGLIILSLASCVTRGDEAGKCPLGRRCPPLTGECSPGDASCVARVVRHRLESQHTTNRNLPMSGTRNQNTACTLEVTPFAEQLGGERVRGEQASPGQARCGAEEEAGSLPLQARGTGEAATAPRAGAAEPGELSGDRAGKTCTPLSTPLCTRLSPPSAMAPAWSQHATDPPEAHPAPVATQEAFTRHPLRKSAPRSKRARL